MSEKIRLEMVPSGWVATTPFGSAHFAPDAAGAKRLALAEVARQERLLAEAEAEDAEEEEE